MVAAEQEATVACRAERVLRDKLEHVVFGDTMEASPESPNLVNVQAAVEVGVKTLRPLVRVPGKRRDGLADLEADAGEASAVRKLPKQKAWDALPRTGERHHVVGWQRHSAHAATQAPRRPEVGQGCAEFVQGVPTLPRCQGCDQPHEHGARQQTNETSQQTGGPWEMK